MAGAPCASARQRSREGSGRVTRGFHSEANRGVAAGWGKLQRRHRLRSRYGAVQLGSSGTDPHLHRWLRGGGVGRETLRPQDSQGISDQTPRAAGEERGLLGRIGEAELAQRRASERSELCPRVLARAIRRFPCLCLADWRRSGRGLSWLSPIQPVEPVCNGSSAAGCCAAQHGASRLSASSS